MRMRLIVGVVIALALGLVMTAPAEAQEEKTFDEVEHGKFVLALLRTEPQPQPVCSHFERLELAKALRWRSYDEAFAQKLGISSEEAERLEREASYPLRQSLTAILDKKLKDKYGQCNVSIRMAEGKYENKQLDFHDDYEVVEALRQYWRDYPGMAMGRVDTSLDLGEHLYDYAKEEGPALLALCQRTKGVSKGSERLYALLRDGVRPWVMGMTSLQAGELLQNQGQDTCASK